MSKLPTLEVSKEVYSLMKKEHEANPLTKWIDFKQKGLGRDHIVQSGIVIMER